MTTLATRSKTKSSSEEKVQNYFGNINTATGQQIVTAVTDV